MDPQMATRQNKKRKGRSNAPPRERTVTTLTDGVDGPFAHSPTDDLPPALMSPPFVPPIPAAPPPGLQQSPFQMPAFNPSFQYAYSPLSLAQTPSYPSAQTPFFPGSAPGQQSMSLPPPPQQLPPALPPGQNDLEILQSLKETIKNNQHEMYRPVPQPAALASVYLGPPAAPSALSHVPPHPEQIPPDYAPSGPSTVPTGPSKTASEVPIVPKAAPPDVSPRVPPTPDLNTRNPAEHTSVTQSPKPNVRHPSLLCEVLAHPVAAFPTSQWFLYEQV